MLTLILPLFVLLFVATATAVLTKRIRMPLSVMLVVVGLLLGELLRSWPTLAPLSHRWKARLSALPRLFLPKRPERTSCSSVRRPASLRPG